MYTLLSPICMYKAFSVLKQAARAVQFTQQFSLIFNFILRVFYACT